jgi:hypothetical protein
MISPLDSYSSEMLPMNLPKSCAVGYNHDLETFWK